MRGSDGGGSAEWLAEAERGRVTASRSAPDAALLAQAAGTRQNEIAALERLGELSRPDPILPRDGVLL